jgi:basic amino acid/polyamine antiporter, APA family
MPDSSKDPRRTVGLFAATLVGIGGILGGGILVLAGTAFAAAGPAFVVAFALNGVVGFLTAMSIAEISTAFPESGGAYTFAKKVLSVRMAFAVGWVLWFAYIVAGVLYALSFAAYSSIALRGLWSAFGGSPPAWTASRNFVLFLGTLSVVGYALSLARKAGTGSSWPNVAKVVLFSLLIVAGLVFLARQPFGTTTDKLDPFFTGGFGGIAKSMGITFIAIQGFEMIAAIAGEVREPRRTLPRAMFLSILISLAVYLPLLFVIATAGIEAGTDVTTVAAANPETLSPDAVRRFLGEPGYWIIVVGVILGTVTAVQANLLTASRIALAMAGDHTLPEVLERRHPTRGTPIMAIYASALAVIAILFMVSNLASAGAAAGLIFLVAFTLTHLTTYLARRRSKKPVEGAYRTPLFPLVPVAGGLACAGLALYQAVAVPDAGKIMLVWLGLGVMLYVALFKGRAETADASAEALDPRLARLRGKNPLVLLPIANPRNARSLVEMANALAPTEYARVLLLTIVRGEQGLADSQEAVREALTSSYRAGHAPEALITTAERPLDEIRRVAEEHDCESMLIGLAAERKGTIDADLESLINDVDCDVAVMRAPTGWRVDEAKRVLVPIGGRGEEHELRARLLGTLCRDRTRELRFVTVVATKATAAEEAEALRTVKRAADLNIPVTPTVDVVRSDDPASAILAEAAKADLLVLGVQTKSGRKAFGDVALGIARGAPCAVIMLSSKQLYKPLRGAMQSFPWMGGD